MICNDLGMKLSIPLEAALHEGRIPTTSYNVVKDQVFCGQIRVGLSFTREVFTIYKMFIVVWFRCGVEYFG